MVVLHGHLFTQRRDSHRHLRVCKWPTLMMLPSTKLYCHLLEAVISVQGLKKLIKNASLISMQALVSVSKYSTCAGNFPALVGLLVDQARGGAEPQATLLIFLPWSAATSRGLWMALVVPSPSWPSLLSPHVYTSPVPNSKAFCQDAISLNSAELVGLMITHGKMAKRICTKK